MKEFPFDLKEFEEKPTSQFGCGTVENKLLKVGPRRYVMPYKYKSLAAEFYNQPIRDTDVFGCGLARSGTTFTQELVWIIANDMNIEKARSVLFNDRYLVLDYAYLRDEAIYGLDRLKAAPSPRFVKTHLPLSLLPPDLLDKAKVVYVARDARDVIVSLWHFLKCIKNNDFDYDLKTYWNKYRNNQVEACPYFEHVKEAWEKRSHPNMLFLFYEELIRDLPAVIRRTAKFFGKTVTEDQVKELREHFEFNNSKKYHWFDEVNSPDEFYRKGKVGGWREFFDEEMAREAEQWIEENLRGSDFKYPE